MTASVVPEHGHWTIVHELVHILGERELNVQYHCLMNVTVNTFILASVNGTLTWFNFVQYGGYLFINTPEARAERCVVWPVAMVISVWLIWLKWIKL